VRQSGKNSADIRLVVDALDLCYTKAHVDTFVIISGDSDFSPLVSKLRENAKRVIGVGVKQSCSDLLVTNCDEFIYYDDLVREREAQRGSLRRERDNGKRSPEEEASRRAKAEERKTKAVELAAATFADMSADRGENERIWASVLKEVIKRRNPGFNETYFGFRSFGNLLEEAAARGLLGFGRDEKSGAYVMRAAQQPPVPADEAPAEAASEPVAVDLPETAKTEVPAGDSELAANPRRRSGRRSRGGKDRQMSVGEATVVVESLPAVAEAVPVAIAPVPAAVEAESPASGEGKSRRGRRPRKAAEVTEASAVVEAPLAAGAVVEEKPAKTRRPARARKAKASEKGED